MVGDGMSRRDLLKLAGLGTALAGSSVAGAQLLFTGDQPPATTTPSAERSRELAVRFAPDLYFGAREKWFPTDPRRYTSERDGRTVVDGFDALDGYTKAFQELGEPPEPIVFYNAVEYQDAPLAVVQFWFYSVFDQFATNFHWHDWEVLHVFVDTREETDTPILYVGSAHSRKVPNNEFLDPDPEIRPGVISEVGSHSSAVGVNQRRETFQRFPIGDVIADINNSVLALSGVDLPAAYGLPRDEAFRLAYLVPELDGAPIYEHERLPNVTRQDLLPDDLVVRTLVELSEPPDTLPLRRHGLVLTPDDSGDHEYDLTHVAHVRHIDAFTGPQLSFEFAVPGFAEDLVAEHITTAGKPWAQPRFGHPIADVTDPDHVQALANRYESLSSSGATDRLVGSISRAVERTDTEGGVATETVGVEGFCLLESRDPVAVPTWNGIVSLQGIDRDEHRLTVNAPGFAPYTQRLRFEGGQQAVGAEGSVVLVATEDAVKVRADAREQPSSVGRLRVVDEYEGPLYDAPPDGDRFAVYVHGAGSYTAEITDERGEIGAFRLDPDPAADQSTIQNPRTGKASLASFLETYLSETYARGRDVAAEAGVDTGGLPESPTSPTRSPSGSTGGSAETGQSTPGSTPRSTDSGNTTDSGTTTETGTTTTETGTTTTGAITTTTGSRTPVSGGSPAIGVLRGLAGAARAAARASAAADANERTTADERLRGVRRHLDAIADRAERDRGRLPDRLVGLLDRRLSRFRTRVEQALEASAD